MTAKVALAVHAYHPSIGGSEAHVRWLAGALRDRGFQPFIIAPRRSTDPMTVDGIEVTPRPSEALHSDVIFTYSVSDLTLEVAAELRAACGARPGWLHHPCAVGSRGLHLLQEADRVVAFNERDLELTRWVCGSTEKVLRIFPGAPVERQGHAGRFRIRVRHPYLLWVGAWTSAKGPRNLSEKFAAFRARHPRPPLRLVMFGASGGDEWPLRHPEILTFDRNWNDVPDAIADCLCVVFNSPPHPVGYDANPMVLLEAILNRKTFVARAGTPLLSEVNDLGLVVGTDAEWADAVEQLVLLPQLREGFEAACARAAETRYNFRRMIDAFEAGLLEVMAESQTPAQRGRLSHRLTSDAAAVVSMS